MKQKYAIVEFLRIYTQIVKENIHLKYTLVLSYHFCIKNFTQSGR